jgi:hypothetical protein
MLADSMRAGLITLCRTLGARCVHKDEYVYEQVDCFARDVLGRDLADDPLVVAARAWARGQRLRGALEEVFVLFAMGFRRGEVATERGTALSTVRTQEARICARTGDEGITEAVLRFLRETVRARGCGGPCCSADTEHKASALGRICGEAAAS